MSLNPHVQLSSRAVRKYLILLPNQHCSYTAFKRPDLLCTSENVCVLFHCVVQQISTRMQRMLRNSKRGRPDNQIHWNFSAYVASNITLEQVSRAITRVTRIRKSRVLYFPEAMSQPEFMAPRPSSISPLSRVLQRTEVFKSEKNWRIRNSPPLAIVVLFRT